MLWQKLMITLATNPQAKHWMQNSRKMTNLASRFVGGKSAQEGSNKAEQLHLQQDKRSSLFYLGEYVQDQKEIAKTLHELEKSIKQLAEKNLDIHISIDPTQIGLMNDVTEFKDNATHLSMLIKEHSSGDPASSDFLMIDMEDDTVTQTTLDVYHFLHEKGLPCAVTLQIGRASCRERVLRLV